MGLLLFLQPFLKMISSVDNQLKKDNYLELQIGKLQMEHEIKESKFDKIAANKLYYSKEDGEKIIFEQYKDMIRKTSNKNGHQPIVMGVKKVYFTELDKVIKMEVTTLEAETYIYYLQKE